MILKKLKKYIFDPENIEVVKFAFGLFLSFSIMGCIFIFNKKASSETPIPQSLEENLQVMIPKGYVLYPFQASNFEVIEPLLEAYNMVKVYNSETGVFLAEHIKVLRAPKDPEHLAFLIPIDIANKFATLGMNFRVVLQKYTDKKPKLLSRAKSKKINTQWRQVTYGN